MSRYNGRRVFVNTNVDEIFQSVVEWEKTYNKVPDQQDPVYTMVDIACNTDLVLMQKHVKKTGISLHDYLLMYDKHENLNTTMATKYPGLLTLDVRHFNKPPRVRVSLMPQAYSNVLEPKMQKISSRIEDINRLKDLGWEVHINYSPVVFQRRWIQEYDDLFAEVKRVAGVNKCEVIVLTNHKNQMAKASVEAQELMKYSSEIKNNSGVMRYPIRDKTRLLQQWKQLYNKYFELETIRYIF